MIIKTTLQFLAYRKLPYLLMAVIIALALLVMVNAAAVLNKSQGEIKHTPYFGETTFSVWLKYLEQDVDYDMQAKKDEAILLAMAEVETVSFATPVPFGGGGPELKLQQPNSNDELTSSVFYADEQFVPTLAVDIIAGRNFISNDVVSSDEDASVALINKALALKLFGEYSVVGKVITAGDSSYTIVGVIDPLVGANFKSTRGQFVVVLPQVKLGKWTSMLVKFAPDTNTAIAQSMLENALQQQALKRVIAKSGALPSYRAAGLRKDFALSAMLSAVMGAFMLVVFATVWGVVKFNFVARQKTMGILRALGISHRKQSIAVAGEFTLVCMLGVLLGGLLSLLLSPWLQSQFSIEPLQVEYILGFGAGLQILVLVIVQLHLMKCQKQTIAETIYQ
ncbi:ABC transporter permease [Pseudoalteromonas sp. PS5]|uniref:ABC transporter permease n=1 Tax=Pseudoalteromonas sp. PS5 TaxID=1437473 RepID=UPI000FFF56F8|nr:ABC transporter permease [Pseudoalteromonas sp. PS5]RXF01755.1 FtsX-like permease family protein [Pseudoalteromonas sp. PS5]